MCSSNLFSKILRYQKKVLMFIPFSFQFPATSVAILIFWVLTVPPMVLKVKYSTFKALYLLSSGKNRKTKQTITEVCPSVHFFTFVKHGFCYDNP